MNQHIASPTHALRGGLNVATGLALILLFLLAGEQAAMRLQLGLPGQIVGLAVLCAALVRLPRLETLVAAAAQLLLRFLPLLILPAGVGSALLVTRADALWFAVICAVTALATTAAVGVVAQRLFTGTAAVRRSMAP